MKQKSCSHLETFERREGPYECEECVKTGDEWVHLRTCQTCGITLCCDSSVNRHARKHFYETGHPVIASAEPEDSWAYCYVDQLYRRL